MLSYFDAGQNELAQMMGRHHPWTVTLNTPDGRYYDFRERPQDIRSGLEDLRYALVGGLTDTIVDFISWVNGKGSIFETNDFGLRPTKRNEDRVSQKSQEQQLRLTILFRELSRNTPTGKLKEFAVPLQRALQEIDPDFDQACWGWSLWPHLFTALGGEQDAKARGDVVQLNLWAWGNSAEELATNLARGLTNLRTALEWAQNWYERAGFGEGQQSGV